MRAKGEGALIAYITLGDPSPEESFVLAQSLIDSGSVDVLELGIPFSDPIADGPVIQAAVDRALKAGMNTDIAFDLSRRLKKSIPIVYLTYYNIVLQRGVEKFVGDCADAGVSGIIIADLPFEESRDVRNSCAKYGVDYINIVTPNTPPGRMRIILEGASGFVYVVSNMGVTGARQSLSIGLRDTVSRTIECANGVPVAVGFGISKPAHVSEVIGMGADGAIVGSAIVDMAARKAGVHAILGYVKKLKEGTMPIAPKPGVNVS
ncbi:tryptophan synthase subunit alpha [Methanocella conradii]|uniref:tryptophan synthase subunit alpha n=1 Tax=Methanocella conradii TaxID=1175444 RepID=UPI002351CFB1|nr:tryptophan synthase subunit alpha [Methanocella conradii]